MTEETNDVRERLQDIARTIAVMLPPNTGYALLAFDFGPGGRLEYVANAEREDVCKTMVEFINKTDDGKYAKHLKDGPLPLPGLTVAERTCVYCGCTDSRACAGGLLLVD